MRWYVRLPENNQVAETMAAKKAAASLYGPDPPVGGLEWKIKEVMNFFTRADLTFFFFCVSGFFICGLPT